MEVARIAKYVERVRQDNAVRDHRMAKMAAVLSNRAGEVLKDILPDDYPEPIVENTIRSAAEDLAYMIGVLPTLSAAGLSPLDESKRSRADKLSKIIGALAYESSIGNRLPFAALQQVAYGFSPFRVEPMFDEHRPHVSVDSAIGAYYQRDRFRRMVMYFRASRLKARELAGLYPEMAGQILRPGLYGGWDRSEETLEIVRFWDDDVELLFVPKRDNLVLERLENRLGRVPVRIADGEPTDGPASPSMNDALWVMAAKAELALLTLEAANKAVQAPLAVPTDVETFELGADSVIRTNSPRDVGRVTLDIPNASFLQVSALDEELKRASHYPDVRAGMTDASVVTGRGVQALMGGFDQRVRAYQSNLGEALADIMSMALEMDKTYFGSQQRKTYASMNGTSYEVTYTPNRDIYSTGVSAEYGVMAGMDPNRALVWSLQALGAGLVSSRWAMENLPVAMNIGEELKTIDVESLRKASMAAVQSYAQAIPQLAASGQDVTTPIRQIVQIIDARKKGVQIEDAMAEAFKPPEPSPEEQAAMQAQQMGGMPGQEMGMPGQMGGMPGQEMAMAGAGGGPNIEMPYQPPSQAQLLAQLSGSGEPRTSVRTVRTRNL